MKSKAVAFTFAIIALTELALTFPFFLQATGETPAEHKQSRAVERSKEQATGAAAQQG